MPEFTAVASAQRQRLLLAEQQRLDQHRANVVRRRQDSSNNAQRRQQIIAERVELDARRIRDRRNDIEFEIEAQLSFDEQQRVLDTIDNDTLSSAIKVPSRTSSIRRVIAEKSRKRDCSGTWKQPAMTPSSATNWRSAPKTNVRPRSIGRIGSSNDELPNATKIFRPE